MRNVEFKAELRDRDLAVAACRRLGAVRIGALKQTDTYFNVADGKLKRRETAGEETEWILYHRPDKAGVRISDFTLYSDAEALARYGERPLPVWIIVRKTRDLWMRGGVRIHLDDVETLGEYFELEALLSSRQNAARAQEEVASLRAQFQPVLGETISCGYSDLIASAITDEG